MNQSESVVASSESLGLLNQQLSEILKIPSIDLASGASTAMSDELVLCGVLGGKDVGKSTLINALARHRVSVDSEEVGRGTDRAIAYVHEDSQHAVAHRMRGIEAQVRLEVCIHRADAIRNVVLVDLPDFDSEFLQHLELVRAVAPLLDRILWVLTPRKVGDRAWVEMLNEVVKDAGNVHCVLNKVDELLSDGDLFEDPTTDQGGTVTKPAKGMAVQQAAAFWNDQHRWVTGMLAPTPCPDSDDHRFLVAAAFPQVDQFVDRVGRLWDDSDWSRYGEDRDTIHEIAQQATAELDRLRECVLSPVSEQESRAIKSANQRQEQRVNVARLQGHYDLDRTMERLVRVCDPAYQQQILAEAFDVDYCTGLATTLQSSLRPERALADELLEQRVEGWPLLRLVYWPFGWLSRLIGTSRGFQTVRPRSELDGNRKSGSGEDPLDAKDRVLERRVDGLRSRLLADHAVLARQLGLESAIPDSASVSEGVRLAARRVAPELETRLLAEIRGKDRRPGIFGKFFLWVIFLWFPFVQPVLAGLLEIFDGGGAWDVTHGLYKIVSALSAAHLLAGFAVVAAVFVALLAGMYARALRQVRAARSRQDEESPVADIVDEILVGEVATKLATPFARTLERLQGIRNRLTITLSS